MNMSTKGLRHGIRNVLEELVKVLKIHGSTDGYREGAKNSNKIGNDLVNLVSSN